MSKKTGLLLAGAILLTVSSVSAADGDILRRCPDPLQRTFSQAQEFLRVAKENKRLWGEMCSRGENTEGREEYRCRACGAYWEAIRRFSALYESYPASSYAAWSERNMTEALKERFFCKYARFLDPDNALSETHIRELIAWEDSRVESVVEGAGDIFAVWGLSVKEFLNDFYTAYGRKEVGRPRASRGFRS